MFVLSDNSLKRSQPGMTIILLASRIYDVLKKYILLYSGHFPTIESLTTIKYVCLAMLNQNKLSWRELELTKIKFLNFNMDRKNTMET